MKTKAQVSSQLLILVLSAIVFVLMIQISNAQSLLAANSLNQQTNSNQSLPRGNVLSIKVTEKPLGTRLLENTTLGYYQQFLGPTMGGNSNETYNIFQAAGVGNERDSGRAPLQSFHIASLRHQINSDWGVGASLAMSNGYTSEVRNNNNDLNEPKSQFFNARALVFLPTYKMKYVTFISTVAYEAPTSEISKDDEMRYGWVAMENFSFNLNSPKWTAGVLGQAYRMYYKNNQQKFFFPDGEQAKSTQLQTLILSASPYVNYRVNDHWQVGQLLGFDWDQRGAQTGSGDFNNNLPHRSRTTLSYFPSSPSLKYLANVGVFAQALLKFRPETTAIGAELALKF